MLLILNISTEGNLLLTDHVLLKYAYKNTSKYWLKYTEAFQYFNIFRLTSTHNNVNKDATPKQFTKVFISLVEMLTLVTNRREPIYINLFDILNLRQEKRTEWLTKLKSKPTYDNTAMEGEFLFGQNQKVTILWFLKYSLIRARVLLIKSKEEKWINPFHKVSWYLYQKEKLIEDLSDSKLQRPHGDCLFWDLSYTNVKQPLWWFFLDSDLAIQLYFHYIYISALDITECRGILWILDKDSKEF